jgi:hypothetical protein
MALESSLCEWVTWFFPEHPPLKDISELRSNPSRLFEIARRLLPRQLRPWDDDPLEYLWISLACYIRRSRYGTDQLDLTPPDEVVHILEHLFFVFRINDPDKNHFPDGSFPQWWKPLDDLYEEWSQSEPAGEEFPLGDMGQKISSDNDKLKRQIEELRVSSQSSARSPGEIRFISDFEAPPVRGGALQQRSPMRSPEVSPISEAIPDLGNDDSALDEEIAHLEAQLREADSMRLTLACEEEIQLKVQMNAEKDRQAELIQREQLIDEEFAQIDLSEKERLLQLIRELEDRVAKTNPTVVKARWKAKLHEEERKVNARIKNLSLLLALGTDLGQMFAQ